jgi:hypothetical protein
MQNAQTVQEVGWVFVVLVVCHLTLFSEFSDEPEGVLE